MDADIMHGEDVEKIHMEGEIVEVDFTTHVEAFDLDFAFHSEVLAILIAKNNFQSDYDGFIGIAPLTSLAEDEELNNFVLGLKHEGYIDHLIVTLINDSIDKKSIIKFGDYEDAVFDPKNDDQFVLLETISNESWNLGVHSAFFG